MKIQKLCAIGVGVATSLVLVAGSSIAASEGGVTPWAEGQNLMAQGPSTEPVSTTCVALQEVTTGQTEIRKRIENRVIAQGNWNTDFLVPSDQDFSYFVAIITPENDAAYELIANLRFSDGSSEQALSGRADLTMGETYSIPFQSPTFRQPAVVNTRVGGTNGNFYTISVAACP
ncbi:MAG: hypothetical protein HC922_10215 [Leptolyngbyaceae cyanobacterium SM2_3_12]|nr:hypothetical protein [Leptolyngbyaceae cyanobacterium SM2_3_12]